MCRYMAKNVVASGIAKKCLIQVSYAIGVADPISFYVDTMGTSKYSSEEFINRGGRIPAPMQSLKN